MTSTLQENFKAVISHIVKPFHFILTHSKSIVNCSEKMFLLIFSELAVRSSIQTWGEWVLSFRPCHPLSQPDGNLMHASTTRSSLMCNLANLGLTGLPFLVFLPYPLVCTFAFYLVRSLTSPCKMVNT